MSHLKKDLSKFFWRKSHKHIYCLLYTSDAADERSSVDLGGRRIIKKKKKVKHYTEIGMSEETH